MKNLTNRVVNLLVLCVLVGTTCRMYAEEPTPLPPDLTRGGKRDKNHDYMLGPTGARGWMFCPSDGPPGPCRLNRTHCR